METDPDNLVRAAQLGELHAANKLVERHYRAVYAFLRRLAGNDEDAADLTQRTFARLWQALPTFARRSSFSSWIHGIAYHVYVDWRRAVPRTEPRPSNWWLECPCPTRGPDQAAADADLRRTLYAVVDQLEPDLRETVHLHYYQELTLEDTAAAMDIATSTVKYRLRQAIAKLQAALRADAENLKDTQTYEASRT